MEGFLIFAIFMFVMVVMPVLFFTRIGTEFFHNVIGYGTTISRAEYVRIDKTLTKHMEYYERLSVKGRARFVHRVTILMRKKQWIGRDGLKLTEEMKILVSGAAVQLTYGLRHYKFTNIRVFILYPNIFSVPMLDSKLRGGTSPQGSVMLSWRHLVEGYADETDKLNLGLHEMTHALQLELRYRTRTDNRFEAHINGWFRAGRHEFKRLKEGAPSFLRKYAGTNKYEFFAVSVEHFFEAAEDFHKELPQLYKKMCQLLGQDPRNAKGDYRYKRPVGDAWWLVDVAGAAIDVESVLG